MRIASSSKTYVALLRASARFEGGLRESGRRQITWWSFQNENRLARFYLFEAVSVDGRGDAGLRDSQHADGGGVSGGDEEGDR